MTEIQPDEVPLTDTEMLTLRTTTRNVVEPYAALRTDLLRRLLAERDRLAAVIQQIRVLHYEINTSSDGARCCHGCWKSWPCPTARLGGWR